MNSPLYCCNIIVYTYESISCIGCPNGNQWTRSFVERLETRHNEKENPLRETYKRTSQTLEIYKRRIHENYGYALADNNIHNNSGSSFSAYPALFLLLLGIVFQAAHTGVAGNAVQTRDALG